jgi:hypothetical protein
MRITTSGAPILFATLMGIVIAPLQPAAAGRSFCPDPAYAIPRKVPSELLGTVSETFHIDNDATRASVVMRCVGPKLLACYGGANLNCDKADRRRSLPGATAWCHDNPRSKGIPMAVTGHATIYEWSCEGRHAVAGKLVSAVDPQGYPTDNWKELLR